MNPQRRSTLLDRTGLLIIGVGASLFHYYFEASLRGAHVNTLITVALILMISLFTQYLVNNINSSKRALQIANETLEQKVKERTTELRSSELKYRTIFENTGAATIIIEPDQKTSVWREYPPDSGGTSSVNLSTSTKTAAISSSALHASRKPRRASHR